MRKRFELINLLTTQFIVLRRLYCHNLDDLRMSMEYLLQSSNVIGVNFVILNSVLPF